MKPIFIKFIFSALILSLVITGCKKDNIQPDEDVATVNLGISDAKDAYAGKSDLKNIIDPSKLSKCEISIASIQLKNDANEYIEILDNEVSIDLRQFKGAVKDLSSILIPLGSYTGLKVIVSGVSTTYEGNNYSASSTTIATVTLADYPTQVFDETHGVVNAFSSGNVTFELPLSFTLDNISDIENIRLFYDAEASSYVIPYTYLTLTFNFAGIRPIMSVGVILEQGIQQIKHSPPMGITIVGTDDVNYYGIHTFFDFDGNGGTINSHTSQHVFRGEDGSLLVDAEDMAVNQNPLSPTEISATSETDVKADETFQYSQIISNLDTKGYTLESGETYYFSLRKTWNITTNGTTYDLTRICEPIPVHIP